MCMLTDSAIGMRKIGIAGFAVVLSAALSQASAGTLTPPWLTEYYQLNQACSTASVQSISPHAGQIVVALEIESATSTALVKMTESDRSDWIALHCPPEHRLLAAGATIPAEDNKVNVSIRTHLPALDTALLNCSEYFASVYEKNTAKENRFLERLQQLLQRGQ